MQNDKIAFKSVYGMENCMIKNIGKNILNIIAVLIIFIFSNEIGMIAAQIFDNHYLALITNSVVYIAVLLLLGGLYSKKVLKMDMKEIGVSKKGMSVKYLAMAILLPIVILLIYIFIIPGHIVKSEEKEIGIVLAYAILRIGINAGIGEEFCFRGLMFRYMKKTLGVKAAVIIPAVVFASLHITNMDTFHVVDLMLLLLAGSSVSVMFTMMALKSETIWVGALSHALWNILIIGGIFGIGDIVNGTANNAIIQIIPDSSNILLTGGNFGVEASIVAIIGYVLVAVICAKLGKKAE